MRCVVADEPLALGLILCAEVVSDVRRAVEHAEVVGRLRAVVHDHRLALVVAHLAAANELLEVLVPLCALDDGDYSVGVCTIFAY